MYLKENEKAIQMIKWIRKDATNALIWDILCGDSWFEYTIEDCIDMLEKTAEAGMYQFAFILISRLSKCQYMNEAVTNVIVNRINAPSMEFGVITECIKEFRHIAGKRGILKRNMEE